MRGRNLALQLLPHLQTPAPEAPGWDLVPKRVRAALVLDTGEGTVPVTWEDLEAWGLDVFDAWAAAMRNLRRRSSASHWRVARRHPVWRYESPDPEGAARLFVLDQLMRPFPAGGVLVGVPSPGLLVALPLREREDFERVPSLVAACALAYLGASRPLTDRLLWTDTHLLLQVPVKQDDAGVTLSTPPEVIEAIAHLDDPRLAVRVADA